MAGLQIRWRSLGRAALIAAAVTAGIISLPALLGSDRPPPVPPDVGLVPPASEPAASAPSPPAASPSSSGPPAPQKRTRERRLAGRTRAPERSHPHRKHRHQRRQHPQREGSRAGHHVRPQARPAPAPVPPPAYVPPAVYSYVPPREPGEFGIER